MDTSIEELIGREFKCLDKGFVRLVDIMGDDNSIVQAARVSYGKGTKSVNIDRELIRYLMRHKHTSPFEMVELKFHVKLPIFVARQWIRHRTANVNEYSGRYSEMKDEFYVPDVEQVRLQSAINKQGRSEDQLPRDEAEQIVSHFKETQDILFNDYKKVLDKNLARELARINLPLSNYTEWYWKIDLHNLLHFLRLRLDWHAQYEIREYAATIADILKQAIPMAWESFEDYVLKGESFSRAELGVIGDLIKDLDIPDELLAQYDLKGLEAKEFRMKLSKHFNK